MTEHIATRRKLANIADIRTFNELLERSTLSIVDKEILRMHYLEGYDFRFIGDQLGFAEVTIITRHKKALKKLNSIL